MKNNQNNSLVTISPTAQPASSIPAKRSPEPPVPEKVPATSVSSLPSSPSPYSTRKKERRKKIYHNSDTCKAQILYENKNKSGIYMWKNLVNEKQYIGSEFRSII